MFLSYTILMYPGFYCLFCHGYKDRGSTSSGVLAVQSAANVHMALHLAENATQLSSQVTIYMAGSVELASQLEAATAGGSEMFKVDTCP